MKRELLAVAAAAGLAAGQLTVGVADAGGWSRHGPGYGHYESFKHRGHFGGPGHKYRGYGYGHRRHHHRGHKYEYLLGGLILGATATYLFSQPRYIERETIVYRTAPAPYGAVNPTLGSVLEYNRTGEATIWQDPDSGQTLSTAPVRTHMTPAGPCREYVTSVIIGGQEQQAYGTACRQNDGSWRVQN